MNHPRRVVYRSFGPSQEVDDLTLEEIIDLGARVATKSQQNLGVSFKESAKALSILKRRVHGGTLVVAYLFPEETTDQTMPAMLTRLSTDPSFRKELTPIGSGAVRKSTGVLSDLYFDYEIIDGLELDYGVDWALLETLRERYSGPLYHLVDGADSRRAELLRSMGFEAEPVEDSDSCFFSLGLGELFGADGDTLQLAEEVSEEPASSEESPRERALRELHEEIVGWSDLQLSRKVSDEIFGEDKVLLAEADSYGVDTQIRERAFSVLSQKLIGEDWPTNGAARNMDVNHWYDRLKASLAEFSRK